MNLPISDQPKLDPAVLKVARHLQELVDKKYRGKATIVFHPEGVLKGVETICFYHMGTLTALPLKKSHEDAPH